MNQREIIKEELESLRYIYPELEINSEFTFCKIEIPIQLETALNLELILNYNDKKTLKNTTINHLPTIRCTINIPDNYPMLEAPIVKLDNVDSWLSQSKIAEILDDLHEIWNVFKDSVLYSYIDYIKTNSEIGFNVFKDNNTLRVYDEKLYSYFNKENELAEQAIFDIQTFTCDICQSEHKGVDSTKFRNCEHVFCNVCLSDYFTHIIKRGEIENIHCPSFECTKNHNKYIEGLNKVAESGTIVDFQKFDIEFFELPLSISILKRFLSKENSTELIERYQLLHYRGAMNSYRRYFPYRVAACPRPICATTFIKKIQDSKLAICPTCSFAFCSECFRSWHGEMNACSIVMKKIPQSDIQSWIDHHGDKPSIQTFKDREICSNISFKYGKRFIELAVNDFIAQEQFEELIKSGDAQIVSCPNCSTYIQRSDGCNKMTCSKCLVFFCNICGDRLNRNDPYEHYNNPMNDCFGKLFEGMTGTDEVPIPV